MTSTVTAPFNEALPVATVIASEDFDLVTREQVLHRKKAFKQLRCEAGAKLKEKNLLPAERDNLYKEAQFYHSREVELEDQLKEKYLPQHSPHQLLNPRIFFVSPLFRVASRAAERAPEVEIVLTDERGEAVTYVGPELRQAEGLVFMALVNIARDVKAGVVVQFQPQELCMALFGRYDGPTRARLKDYIRRLQKGQIRTKDYTVQLCLRFNHPTSGAWSVALDSDIVKLFAQSNVWLNLKDRIELSEGLTSWLYGYVEAQTSLIPLSIETLRNLCGAEACDKAFCNSLRKALGHLKEHALIDEGFRIEKGVVYWRKLRK